jgi:hypothetical protein
MESFLRREREELKTRWTLVIVLLTCLTMILVVTQQGGTIDTQRNLIRLLWDDSKQLNKIRIQDLAKQREQMNLTDPNNGSPEQKPPAAKPAPEPRPGPPPAQRLKPARALWQI